MHTKNSQHPPLLKLKYEIVPNENLLLSLTSSKELEDAETIEELLESLVANSELDWLDPSICGDLTDAPMLAILDYCEQPLEAIPGNGRVAAGFWDGQAWSRQVLHRWGWMQYETKDLLEEIREKRCAILQSP